MSSRHKLSSMWCCCWTIVAMILVRSSSLSLANATGDGGPNSPVFNLDHTALEKNIAAIFNKVAHSSATTKRSVPAYEAQVSASTTLSTVPSPLTTTRTTPRTRTRTTTSTTTARTRTTTTSTITSTSSPTAEAAAAATATITSTTMPSVPSLRYPIPRVTLSPAFRDLPSYAPPSRAPFTPPLPPEYVNPFADKPTLRGTNSESSHAGLRRPIPPPSLTPAHERIPIRPPDLALQSPSQQSEKHPSNGRNKALNTPSNEQRPPAEPAEFERRNSTNDFAPTLHYLGISRILSGSNGRKQDIPEILLKPLSTKPPLSNVPAASTIEGHHPTSSTNSAASSSAAVAVVTTPPSISTPITATITTLWPFDSMSTTTTTTTSTASSSMFGSTNGPSRSSVTHPTIFNLPNTRRQDDDDIGVKTGDVEIVDAERLPYPQPQPPGPSKRPSDGNRIVPRVDAHPLESTWRIAWSLHVYVAAIMFTLMALYSIYKIVRFNEATNLLTQSYFLTVHLLLTTVCTLRCFHLFYDAYNLGHSLPEPLSRVLMYLPAPLLSTAFATLVLYLAKCSEAPALNNNKFLSPAALGLCSTAYILVCVSLHVSTHVLGYEDDAKILPLVCQCVYIVVCVTLGLSYMYVYRVVRSRISVPGGNKTVSGGGGGGGGVVGTGGATGVGSHVPGDPTAIALGTAITTTIATGLLFILMGFVQLYGIFGVEEPRMQPYPWLWWGWQFSVRLIELSMCGLVAWVASLSQYPLREKQLEQHSGHAGFALFPCGSSTSTENMDDVLYPAICSANQAMHNYTMRTGKQVYDDSFPLNTLPEHLNISGTFERHSIRKSGTMGHFPHDGTRGGGSSSLNRHGNGVQTLRSSETRAGGGGGRHTPLQGLEHQQIPASGCSTMLVAEDGFVRFRSLGTEDDDDDDDDSSSSNHNGHRHHHHLHHHHHHHQDRLSDTQSVVGTHGRAASLVAGGSVRYSARHPNAQPQPQQQQQQQPQPQQQQYLHQHSLQHPHSAQPPHLQGGHHQSHHQLYNNT